MKNQIKHQTFDAERALYGIQDTEVSNCIFAGPQDGESALKEARRVCVADCSFSLRYPFWHTQEFQLLRSNLDDQTRAPIWYAMDGQIEDCTIDGVKCLRECIGIQIKGCTIRSPEFGWKCKDIGISHAILESEYFLFESQNVKIDHVRMKGKYAFQYMKNVHIQNAQLDTKDAFWHSEHITIVDSEIKGEYLGWYSKGLTFINCRLIGTQPLCYCQDLKLINCTMEDADFAFEYSEVDADIHGNVISIKNPKAGTITVDSVGEIIWEGSVIETKGNVVIRDPVPCLKPV